MVNHMNKILVLALLLAIGIGLAIQTAATSEAATTCSCVEYVKRSFGLSGSTSASGHAKDMGPFLSGKGFARVSNPVPGALVILSPGVAGAHQTSGHVAIILEVQSANSSRDWKLKVRHAGWQSSSRFTHQNCNNVSDNWLAPVAKGASTVQYWVRQTTPLAATITSPQPNQNFSTSMRLSVSASGGVGGPVRFEFGALYSDNPGSTAAYWHRVGDATPGNGWTVNWNTSGVPQQSGVVIHGWIVDAAGNRHNNVTGIHGLAIRRETVPTTNRLLAGQQLTPGQSITSTNGCFRLIYQSDGNLVLYRLSVNQALWASNTVGSARNAVMQGDGNFVVYSASGSARWSSKTSGNSGSWLVVQGDGNVVIYRPNGGPAIWATNTVRSC